MGPLLNGARLAVPRPGLLSTVELAEAIDRFGVTTMFLTTALFNRFVDDPAARPTALRQLLTGGEVASAQHMRRFLEAFPACRLTAVYGPTENTTFSTWCDVTLARIAEPVPIGKPIANSTAFVLDERMRPVEAGEPGELYLGGDGVGCGYLNVADAATTPFIANPFSEDPSARLFRSGDRVRWRADGMLDFLGRNDHQVKVRGFRVELGEIELALVADDAVREAAVVLVDRDGESQLVAHVVPAEGPLDHRALRARLGLTLPAFAVPHRIVERAALPLTPGGKVDRTLLATAPLPIAAPRFGERDGRGVGLERAVGAIWSELLGRECELDENFFDAGGDSLRLLAMQQRLAERLDANVSVNDLLEWTTIRKIAAHVARATVPA